MLTKDSKNRSNMIRIIKSFTYKLYTKAIHDRADTPIINGQLLNSNTVIPPKRIGSVDGTTGVGVVTSSELAAEDV